MTPASSPRIETVSPEGLREYMAKRPEGSYVLVDVRQPGEYRQEHIPGARLAPLGELQGLLSTLDPAQDHVFYCRSGGRSLAAAHMAVDSGLFAAGPGAGGGRILNLSGGMTAWSGQAVAESPRVQAFAGVRGMIDLLLRALDMEKAAHLLYSHVRDAAPGTVVCALMDRLIGVELAHAKVVYHHLAERWRTESLEHAALDPLLPFDDLFAGLEGQVLEGGLSVTDVQPWVRAAASGDCLAVAELALEVEMNAYDLYRTLADEARRGSGLGGLAERAFLDLATQEKTHGRMIIDQLAELERQQEAR